MYIGEVEDKFSKGYAKYYWILLRSLTVVNHELEPSEQLFLILLQSPLIVP